MSVEVPPISMVMMSGIPASWATWALATTPPAGPDRTVCTGFIRALSRLMRPPAASMTIIGFSLESASPSRASTSIPCSDSRYFLHNGAEIGVQDRRRRPLVLAEFRIDLGGDADGDARKRLFEDLAYALLVSRIGIGVQEQDADSLYIGRLDRSGDLMHIRLVERLDFRAARRQTTADGEAEVPRYQLLGRTIVMSNSVGRFCRPIRRISRKPRLVTKAVRAPLR